MRYLNEANRWGGIQRITPEDIYRDPLYWREALYDRKMLILRGLTGLSSEQLWDLHLVFGKPWTRADYETTTEMCIEDVPGKVITEYGNLLTPKSIGNREMPWHRDIPWHREKRYPIRTLYPIVMSKGAGDTGTRFCDADVIWNRLDTFNFKQFEKVQVKIQSWYQVIHAVEQPETRIIPLVEEHPLTKRKSMLLNSFGPHDPNLKFSTAKTGTWILDTVVDGKNYGLSLINDLHRVVCTPDNIYTHSWELGDFVLFDNWSGVFHSRAAVNAQPGAERKFWRVNLRHEWQ